MAVICYNRSHKEYKALKEAYKSDAVVNKLIEVHQELTKSDAFPSLVEAEPIFSSFRNIEDPLLKEKYFTDSDTQTASSVLEKIAKSDHPLNKLAKQLLPHLKDSDIEISLVDSVKNASNAAGGYFVNNDRIEIKRNARFPGRGAENTILHEVIHGLTTAYLHMNSRTAEYFEELFMHAQDNLKGHYGLTDIDEFMAELFTNAAFVRALQGVPALNKQKYQNLFEELFDYILGLFGFEKGDTLYSEAFAVATNIISARTQSLARLKELDLIDALPRDSAKDLHSLLTKSGAISFYNGKYYIKQSKYPEAVKLVNSLKTSYPGIKITRANFFGKGGREVFYVDVTPQGDLFQQEAKEPKVKEVPSANQNLEDLTREYLRLMGVKVEEVDSLMDEYGRDASALADIINRIIKVSRGESTPEILTEEAVHFMIALLGQNNPLVKRLMNLVTKTQTYKDVLDEYEGEYNDLKDYQQEAVGKMITEYILNKVSDKIISETEGVPRTWIDDFKASLKLFMNKVFGMFKQFTTQEFERRMNEAIGLAGDKFLNKDTSELKWENATPTVLLAKRKGKGYDIFNKFPFQVTNLNKMKSGEKKFTIRPEPHKTGEYIFSAGTYRITNMYGKKVNIKDKGILDASILRPNSIGSEDIKHQHIKDFYDGKAEMYVYQIEKISNASKDLSPPSSIKEYIEHWENAIRRLKAQKKPYDTETNRKKNAEIDAKVTQYEERIKTLEETQDITYILGVVQQELLEVSNFLAKYDDYSKDERSSMFKLVNEYLAAAIHLPEFLFFEEESLNKKLADLAGAASVLQQRVLKQMASYFETYSDGDLELSDIAGIKASMGAGESLFLDISRSAIPLLQKIYQIITHSMYTAMDKAKQIYSHIDKEVALLKEYQKKKGVQDDKIFDFFIEKDKDGNYTGKYVDQFMPEYFNILKELADKAKTTKSKSDWKAFFRWREANSTRVIDQKAYEEAKEAARRSYMYYDEELKEEVLNGALFEKWVSEYNPKTGTLFKNPYVSYTPSSKWENAQYKTIQAVPELLRFYNFAVGLIKDRMSKLPINPEDYNYLPELAKNELIDIFKTDLQSVFKGIGTWASDAFKEYIPNTQLYGIKDIDGNPEKQIPFYMMTNSLSPNQKSYDIEAVLKAFSSMSLIYEHKKAVENPVQIAKRLLKESLQDTGSLDKNRRPVVLRRSNQNAIQSAEYYIDAMLYDQRKKVEGAFGKVNSKGKSFTVSRIGDQLIALTQLTMMGVNYFAAMTNFLYNVVAGEVEAQGKDNFNFNEYSAALGIMFSTFGRDLSPMTEKIRLLKAHYNLSDTHYETIESKSKIIKTLGKISMLFMERTERFTQEAFLVAMLMHQKAGKGTLWDAYSVKDGKLVFNPEAGEAPHQDFTKEKTNFSINMRNVIKKRLGNYDMMSPTRASSYILGRLGLVFRRWIPEGVFTRFGGERYDIISKKIVKGQYRSFNPKSKDDIQLGTLEGVKALIASLSRGLAYKSTQEKLSEVDRANMRQNAADLIFILSIMSTAAILANYDVPDDDENVALLKFWISQSIRLEADLLFFVSPGAQTNILQNFAPPLTTLVNIWDAIKALEGLATGQDTYKTGRLKGDSKAARKWLKVTPGGRIYQKSVELSELDPQRMVFGK